MLAPTLAELLCEWMELASKRRPGSWACVSECVCVCVCVVWECTGATKGEIVEVTIVWDSHSCA